MKKIVWCLLLMSIHAVQAQNKVVKHKVVKGDNVSQLAQKYNTTTLEIYRLNPDARAGIKENELLVIPVKTEKEIVKSQTQKWIEHTVAEGETLFSIAKKYKVTLADIEKWNPTITEGLKMDEVLKIPVKIEAATVINNKQNQEKVQDNLYHIVLANDTKFSISKRYHITIEDLEKYNPEIQGKELPLGIKLLVHFKKQKPQTQPQTKTQANNQPLNAQNSKVKNYEVKPQETLFGLSQRFNCSQEELIALNPALKEGVKEGMLLLIPDKGNLNQKKNSVDLAKSISSNTIKKVALLLPFNIEKLDQDTINSTKSRLKKDKFLNMTLDFYSGALMAIDSIHKMGAKVEVTILDSNETKSTSSITSLISENDLNSFQAIIGPFYQNNVEKAASLLTNIPVVSPLSKDYDKKFSNLYQATPLPNDLKQAMFEYMQSKNGNIIAVIDPKKQAIKQYIQDTQDKVKFVNVSEAAILDAAHLKSLLVTGKTNYVIMETEKTSLILATTSQLLAQMKQYDIKLVLLNENETLDFDEIPLQRLTKLKMHYPSITRVNDSFKADSFKQLYKRKNKVVPNAFAVRGFDVTFDTLLRVMQDKDFSTTATDVVTEQMQNKFNYQANPDGGFVNKGLYILYYDNDLTIKQAN